MKFEVEVAGKTVEVEVLPSAAGQRVKIDGREAAADAVWTGASELSLLLDGRSYDVELQSGPGVELHAVVEGIRFPVDVDPLRAGRVTRDRAHGDAVIRSPMPGKVVAVLVEPGEQVEAGRGLVVVEAMKMENELTAPGAGLVRAVHVRQGQVVEGGTALVEIAAATES